MGAWLSRLMRSRGFQVIIYDTNREAAEAKASEIEGSTAESLSELARSSDIIAVSTPQRFTPQVLRDICRVLRGRGEVEKILFDISTFKREVMRAYYEAPRGCRVASVHPLFGPGATDPKKHRVVVVPVPGREDESNVVAGIFEELGFNVEIVDLETHEFYVGLTVGLSYALGYTLAQYTARLNPSTVDRLSGTTFRHLTIHLKSLLLDDEEFIADILEREEVRRHVEEYLRTLKRLIEDPRGALKDMQRVRRSMGGVEELWSAYRRMYECLEGGGDPSQP